MKYGKIVNGVLETQEDIKEIILPDGRKIFNPTYNTILKNGWKKVIEEEKPMINPYYQYLEQKMYENETSIKIVYLVRDKEIK